MPIVYGVSAIACLLLAVVTFRNQMRWLPLVMLVAALALASLSYWDSSEIGEEGDDTGPPQPSPTISRP